MIKILSCDCKSEYQDKVYGKQQRVHNEMVVKNNQRRCRCTVCGKEKLL